MIRDHSEPLSHNTVYDSDPAPPWPLPTDAASTSYTVASKYGRGPNTSEKRLLALAMQHAEELFKEQGLSIDSLKSSRQGTGTGISTAVRRPYVTLLRVHMEPLVLRGTFSNVPLWRMLMGDLALAGQVGPQKGIIIHSC